MGDRHHVRGAALADVLHAQIGLLLVCAVLAGCGSPAATGSTASGPSPNQPSPSQPSRAIEQVSCGGPAFPISLLDEPGNAEGLDDPAAEALRGHLAEPGADFAWLPNAGWREVVRTEDRVVFLADAAQGGDPPYAEVTVERDGAGWRVAGWGQCRLQAAVGPGFGLGSFRIAPGVPLEPGLTEIPVLVIERACNSGQDALGRIVQPRILFEAETVTIIFAIRPREGDHDCPSNPETPFLLVLPEPLGNRTLLDGSEVPPRDVTAP